MNYSPANNERVAFRQLLKTLKRKRYALYERTLSYGVINYQSRRISNMEDILQVQEAAELHEHVKDYKPTCSEKVDTEGQRFDPAPASELSTLKCQNKTIKTKGQKIVIASRRCTQPKLYSSPFDLLLSSFPFSNHAKFKIGLQPLVVISVAFAANFYTSANV